MHEEKTRRNIEEMKRKMAIDKFTASFTSLGSRHHDFRSVTTPTCTFNGERACLGYGKIVP